VLAGSVLLMVVLGCFCAATTLTGHLPTPIEDSILGVFYAANIATVLASVVLARRLSTWRALVLLFLVAAASSASMAGAYMMGPDDEDTAHWILRASYIGLSTVMACFPLSFALVEEVVRLSGSDTTVLAGGAALGPLLTAVVADLSPVTLWFVQAGLLVSSAVVVATLHTCSGCQKSEGELRSVPSRTTVVTGSGEEETKDAEEV